MNDRSVIYLAKLHWIIFLGPALFFIGSFLLGNLVPQLNDFCFILLILAVLWGITNWINYYFSSLTITENQVIIRTGVLIRQTVDIPLNKIESIDIRQSIFGSLLHYGSLVITGTGSTRYLINTLAKPLTCRRHIEQRLHLPT